MENDKKNNKGFTLIELLIGITLLAVVGGVIIVSLNPVGQLGQARNNQRTANLNTLINAISQNMVENKGVFTCAAGLAPTTTIKMAVGPGNYNIASCIIPTYLSVMPFDPSAAGAHYASVTDYDSGYTIIRNASTGVITVAAPNAEFGKVISVSR